MPLDTDNLDWPVTILADLDCPSSSRGAAELSDLLERVGRRFVGAGR